MTSAMPTSTVTQRPESMPQPRSDFALVLSPLWSNPGWTDVGSLCAGHVHGRLHHLHSQIDEQAERREDVAVGGELCDDRDVIEAATAEIDFTAATAERDSWSTAYS